MTRRSHGRPALPPKAKAEILEVLFANMEISLSLIHISEPTRP